MSWREATRLPRAVGALTLLALASACASREVPAGAGEIGADDPAIDALFATWDVPGSPGCALAVAREGDLVYTRGYGYANLDYDLPITPQTVFDVASITKQFVAASLTLLAYEARLSLDDDVRKWLPELPESDPPITLRHMIHHTSGLRDYLNLFPLAGRGDDYPISHPQILAMMSRQRALAFPPGERYEYSNTAYMLLAQVLERAGGQTLGELTRERIFEPLGMDGTVLYDDQEKVIPKRATGYDLDDEGRVRVVHNYNFDVVGDGQLYSTVEDLLRWDHHLHGEKPAIHEQMLAEGTLNDGEPVGYAQGIVLDEYRGLRTVGHSGSSWGFRTQLVRFVEPALSIAVACNFDGARPGELARRVADHYLADRLGPESLEEEPYESEDESEGREAYALSIAALAELAGSFRCAELDATYRFREEGDRLFVRIEQEPPLEVTPVGEDTFEIRFYDQGWPGPQDATLEIDRGPSGDVLGFRLSSGSEVGLVFERVR